VPESYSGPEVRLGKMETLTAARALDLFEPRFYINFGLATIRPEPQLSLPTTPFLTTEPYINLITLVSSGQNARPLVIRSQDIHHLLLSALTARFQRTGVLKRTSSNVSVSLSQSGGGDLQNYVAGFASHALQHIVRKGSSAQRSFVMDESRLAKRILRRSVMVLAST
jgi:hypothetical protein